MANYWSIKKTERKKARRDTLWEKARKKEDFQSTRAFKKFKKVDRKITDDWVKKMTLPGLKIKNK